MSYLRELMGGPCFTTPRGGMLVGILSGKYVLLHLVLVLTLYGNFPQFATPSNFEAQRTSTYLSTSPAAPTQAAMESSRSFLLRFKNALADPDGFLSDWSSNSTTSPCSWTGVMCNSSSISITNTGNHTNTSQEVSDHVNVVGLNLRNMGLVLPLKSALPKDTCKRLPNITYIDFSFNVMQGLFPSSLLECEYLQYVNLSNNFFVGTLPASIDQLQALQVLDLSYNNFSGFIPEAFGKLPQLVELNLFANLLNASGIPAHLGQLRKLQYLRLAYNPFLPGPIAPELGDATGLTYLWLTQCNLIGSIPSSLGNLVNLYNLDLSDNILTGIIPSSLFNLPNLYQLELYMNQLEGSIPHSIQNLTNIVNIDFSQNKLSGTLPLGISYLYKLGSLHLNRNNLSGPLPKGLALLPQLTDISIFSNGFSGSVPQKLGLVSKLVVFDVADNSFTGPLPPYLCEGGALQVLVTMHNRFDGAVPQSYGNCTNVQRLRMNGNRLVGQVPEGVWGLPAINILELSNNYLEGRISSTIGNAFNLSTLKIDNNLFSGSLPDEIGNLSKLTMISLPWNNLTGSMPNQLGNLYNLNSLYLQHNLFSGQIPQEIISCKQLNSLNLSHNLLSGPIPDSLGDFPVLSCLDLSFNLLTGEIPPSLYMLLARATEFNVSYNDLYGEVPIVDDTFGTSFLGNPHLCGKGVLGAKECIKSSPGSSKLLQAMLVLVFTTALLVLVVGLISLYKLHGPFMMNEKPQMKESWSIISFHKVVFSVDDIVNSLDEDNVIGSGGAGKVYRATLNNGEVLAIKKLWSSNSTAKEAEFAVYPSEEGREENAVPFGLHRMISSYNVDRGFRAEVATLGKIRHKNIVKLLCCCESNDTKLLVYEYMSNGSLGDLLHGSSGTQYSDSPCHEELPHFCLDWDSRYKIALGAAQGLTYLHHDCVPPIVHRDVKSNNILLDAQFNAHVADFGVAKMMRPPGRAVLQPEKAGAHDALTNGLVPCQLMNDTDCGKYSELPSGAAHGADHEHAQGNRKSLHMQDHSLLPSSCIAGSYGYIAPEHAYTPKVTEKSDIYSFGMVMLELVTGKKPVVADATGEKIDLVKWVCNKLTSTTCQIDGVRETLDPRIVDSSPTSREEMLLVLRVALLCTSASPSQRPSMREVVELLLQARAQRSPEGKSSKDKS